ncbi:hypothetical protein EsH8_III_000247 [Colletotrichum jinshuiense]
MASSSLKRSHGEFSDDEVTNDDRGLGAGVKHQAIEAAVHPSKAVSPARQTPTRDISSRLSTPESELSDAATNTPPRGTPTPNTTPVKDASRSKQTADSKPSPSNPTASSSTASAAQPAAKRKRRTAAEKEAEEKEKAQKKKEREELKEAKQAEKAKADAEKQAEKQAKLDEKRRKKEEEERKAQEERDKKEKKERAQPKLLSFFTPKAPATPKKEQAAPAVKTESPAKAATIADTTQSPTVKKEEPSEYEKRFKPFYVHSSVRLAESPFEMDDETHEAKQRILGEYFDGKRKETQTGKFDPVEVFQLPCRPAPRGRVYPPVRFTMEKMRKLTQKAEGGSEEDSKAVMKETTDALRRIPVKSLKFYQDLRPPYRGTVTLKPYQAGKDGMRRLARKPTLRDQLPLNYDHDSEAEWESEGEDVDVDDDDDEDLEGDDDMDEFLDDSEDNGPARFVSANGLEPDSTGLCWEDRKRAGPNRTMYEHRMEFILESLEHHSGIDPFSTKYWEPEPKPKSAARPSKDKAAAAAVSSTTPSDAFKAITTKPKDGVQSLPKKILENNNLQELKKVIEANPKIAKGGLIDLSYVALAHAKISRNDIKEAIATIAERIGKGHAGSWTIKPSFDV